MLRRALGCSAAVSLLLAAATVLAPGSATAAGTSAVPRPDHVVVVIEENKAATQIVGNADAPYITSLAAAGANFTASYAITHPSEPNYVALFSGSTQGVTDDSCPHSHAAPSLGDELITAGRTFTGYSQGLPSVGYTGCGSGAYARKHNPWSDFPAIPASANQPFSAFPSDYSTLPDVSFVVPDLQNDMHDGTIAQGDAWLRQNLDGYVQWAKTHNSLLVLTFDEDDNSAANHISTVFVGQSVVAGQYDETINHYNVLRTLEDAFGLPLMGASATAAPITDVWAGNRPPVASFTAACTTSCSFDGGASTDPDGTIAGYQWNFGDGSTGTGVTPTHTYAAAGDYPVTLTVTDDAGATGTASRVVSLGAAVPFVVDNINRTVTNGFGSADVGGAWSTVGTASAFAVASGAGKLTLPRAATQLSAYLPAAARTDTDLTARLALSATPAGGPVYVTVAGRRPSSGNEYSTQLILNADKTVSMLLLRIAGGSQTAVRSAVRVAGLTYVAGAQLDVRLQVTGTNPTQLRARAWLDTATEPTTWPVTATDSTAALQQPGGVGLTASLSSAVTNAPIVASVSRLSARPTTASNVAPTAAFTSTCTQLACHFDATGSTDPDGPIAAYQWSFGDGATGSGATLDHAFAVAGSYPVTLTVADGPGATGTVTHTATATAPPVNQPPTAAFTTTCTQLSCSFDGTGSTDDEGVVAWAWTFGDGGTGTGASPTHAFGASGTYQATLTVTDDDGATGTVTHAVTVSAAAPAFVNDAFQRSVTGAWGTADVGGPWTLSGPSAGAAVSAGHATARLAAGSQLNAYLGTVNRTDADVTTSFSLPVLPVGGPVYVSVTGRRVKTGGEYSAQLLVNPDATVTIRLLKIVSGAGTELVGAMRVPGLTYTAGASVAVRVQVTGTAPTTIRAKAWPAGANEPSAWTLTATDSTAGLQAVGAVELIAYVSGRATNGPLTTSFGPITAQPTAAG
jgi:PKD repeat protein